MTTNWVDTGDAVFLANDFESATDGRRDLAPAGMRSVVTLKSGRWFWTKLGRRGILARVQAAAARAED